MKKRPRSSLPVERDKSLQQMGRLRDKLQANRILPAALDDLLGMAEHHARYWLLGTERQLDVIFFVMLPDGVHMWVVPAPDGRALQQTLRAAVRQRMGESATVSYSFVTEAWSVQPTPEELQQGGYLPENRPSLRPDREEIVTALATDGINIRWGCWKIKRDYKGAIAALEHEPDTGPGSTSVYANLLGGTA